MGVVAHHLQVLRGQRDGVGVRDLLEAVLVEFVLRVVKQRLVEQRLLAREALEQRPVDCGPAAGEPSPIHGEHEPCAPTLSMRLQQPVDECLKVVI